MKKLILTFAAFALTAPAAIFADSYSVFRICEDQHVLRTSDGAEAGRVEYIVVEPARQRIVSTVITGGVVGEKFVAVPFSVMRFGTEREITLTEITRERLVSAPVIERSRFTASAVIEQTVIHPTFAHFGVNISAESRDVTHSERRSRPETATGKSEKAPPATQHPDSKGERATGKTSESAGRTTKEPGRSGERATEKGGRKGDQTEVKGEAGRKADQPEDKAEKTNERVGRKDNQTEDKAGKTTERAGRKTNQPENKAEKKTEKTGEKADQETRQKGRTPGTETSRERTEPAKEKRPNE